jgi:Trk-type K+ transport system membrane component
MFKLYPKESTKRETLAFLLDHPRRCFTLLFPSSATWWLFGILVILNALDVFFFLVLDLGDAYVSAIPVGYRFLDGFFQAVSTRTAGFAVTNLMLLHPAVLVSYLVMMYISIFPVAISIRRTNVYEEQSLGVFAHEDEQDASFVGKADFMG